MNQFLTLEQVKLHLKVDHDDEDSDIEALIDASFIAFEESTNRKLYAENEAIPEDIKNGIHISDAIIQGAKLLIGHWYRNRETTGNLQNLPFATEWLWRRHRFVNMG
jgi:hypothetical protein